MSAPEVIFPHGPYRRPRASWLDTRLWGLAVLLGTVVAVASVIGWGLWLARIANGVGS